MAEHRRPSVLPEASTTNQSRFTVSFEALMVFITKTIPFVKALNSRRQTVAVRVTGLQVRLAACKKRFTFWWAEPVKRYILGAGAGAMGAFRLPPKRSIRQLCTKKYSGQSDCAALPLPGAASLVCVGYQ